MNILKKHVSLNDNPKKTLEHLICSPESAQGLVRRAKIIIGLASGKSKRGVAKDRKVSGKTVSEWCGRRNKENDGLIGMESNPDITPKAIPKKVVGVPGDQPRAGTPPTFAPEQVVGIIAIACEVTDDSEKEISRRTLGDIAAEAAERKIDGSVSPASVRRFPNEAGIRPRKSRYCPNTAEKDPDLSDRQCRNVCDIYNKATELHGQGIRIMSNDEKTGIRALGKIRKTLPAVPGEYPQRIGYNYDRHGTPCLIANFEVATGKIIAPTIGATRKEEDYAARMARTIGTDPDAPRIFIADQPDTHKSASLAEFVALECKINTDSGTKGKCGVLRSVETRQEFLSAPTHRIRFIYTPRHSSWLNQVGIRFSIPTRRLLRYGNFSSVGHLKRRIPEFIAFFNKTMAKPFKRTYKGRPLTA